MNDPISVRECRFCSGKGSCYNGRGPFAKLCPVCDGGGSVELVIEPGGTVFECRFCQGRGGYQNLLFREVCPVCHGAGALVFVVEPGRALLECKFCGGRGGYVDVKNPTWKVCPACQGLGRRYRKRVTRGSATSTSGQAPHAPARPKDVEFDVAISFAGDDRRVAGEYADKLKAKGLSVFYDEYFRAGLWGADLYAKLDDVYRNKARYCVLLISDSYAKKVWTNHERRSAQARAFRENEPYLLPVRLDDTQIPGIPETVGYVDLRQCSIDDLVDLTLEKVRG
jgi:hypothetical protein